MSAYRLIVTSEPSARVTVEARYWAGNLYHERPYGWDVEPVYKWVEVPTTPPTGRAQ